jgi:hypothetical protein
MLFDDVSFENENVNTLFEYSDHLEESNTSSQT